MVGNSSGQTGVRGCRSGSNGGSQVASGVMAAQVERISASRAAPYRPPAPRPRAKRLGPFALISALKRNPLECWTQEHFERPIVSGGLPIGHVVVVNEPAAIRRVLLDN